MRLRVLAILALIVASLILLAAAQTTDYTGKAKIVMKLTKMPEMPEMPQASDRAGLVATTFGMPTVPQGTMVQGEVLYSSDPDIKKGQTYSLYINYDPNAEPTGFETGLVDKLKAGAVVGINDYAVSGSQITVNVGTFSGWNKKISILDMQYADQSGTKNPFMINLNGFRQFDALPVFNATTTTRPMLNMSGFGWSMPSLSGGQQGSSIFGMFSHPFG
jgi:hypothetical protein